MNGENVVPKMAVKGGALATIVICALIGVPLALFLVLFLLRKWMHGPTAGSGNEKQLDDKVVVITGKCCSDSDFIILSISQEQAPFYSFRSKFRNRESHSP